MQIEGFEIKKKVFEDFIGKIFVAEKAFSREAVYLKVLHAEYASDPELVRVFHECQSLAAVEDYQGCLKTLSSGATDATHFIVHEHLNYTLLSDVLARQPFLPILEAVKIIELIGNSVQGLHKLGKKHGTITPQTVYLNTARSDVRLGCFGFTAFVSELVKRQHRHLMAPLPYLGPNIRTADRPAVTDDLYSLGMLLYHLLVGDVPHLEDSLKQSDGGGAVAIVPPSLKRLEIPDIFDDIVFRSVEAGGSRDFADVSAFLEQLAQARSEMMTPQTRSHPPDTAAPSAEPSASGAPEAEAASAGKAIGSGQESASEHVPLSPEDTISNNTDTSDLGSGTSLTEEFDPFSEGDFEPSEVDDAETVVPGARKAIKPNRPAPSFTDIEWLLAAELAPKLEMTSPDEAKPDLQIEPSSTKDHPKKGAGQKRKIVQIEEPPGTTGAGTDTGGTPAIVNPPQSADGENDSSGGVSSEQGGRYSFPVLASKEFDERVRSPLALTSTPQPSATAGPVTSARKSLGARGKSAERNALMVTLSDDDGPDPPAASVEEEPYLEVETEALDPTETMATTQTIDMRQPSFSSATIWTAAKVLLLALIPLVTIYFLIIITFDLEFKDRLADWKQRLLGGNRETAMIQGKGKTNSGKSKSGQRPLLPSELKVESATPPTGGDFPSGTDLPESGPPRPAVVSEVPQGAQAGSGRSVTPELAAGKAASKPITAPETRPAQRTQSAISATRELVVKINVRGPEVPQIADVYIDGQLYGQTDQTGSVAIRNFEKGRAYLIKVQKEGFEMWATEAKFLQEREHSVNVQLRPKAVAGK